MRHSDRTGVSPNKIEAISSISAQFRHMPERYDRVRVGWHCAKAPYMVQFRPLFPELRHFEKKGARHYSLIGRHLESVGRTEPVFKLNLALTEKRSTNECRSNSGNFYQVIVLTSQVATFVPGQRCQVTEG